MNKTKKLSHYVHINSIIDNFANRCSIQKCYFHIKDVKIMSNCDNPSIVFDLGPSFKYSDIWTISMLNAMYGLFGQKIQDYIKKHKIEGIHISTQYRSWAVSGYNINIIIPLNP